MLFNKTKKRGFAFFIPTGMAVIMVLGCIAIPLVPGGDAGIAGRVSIGEAFAEAEIVGPGDGEYDVAPWQDIMGMGDGENDGEGDGSGSNANNCGNPYSHPPAGAIVKSGSTGEYVKWLQYELNAHNNAGLTVDGAAGAATVKAIKDFQKANGLTADGVAGGATIGKIDSLWHPGYDPGAEPPEEPAAPLKTCVDMAKEILKDPISLATTHSSGKSDNANARQNIIDTAAGQRAARSTYADPPTAKKAPGGTVNLDPRLLDAILRLGDKYKPHGTPALLVSEIAGGCHSATSRHYSGKAVDISRINDVKVSTSNFSAAFIDDLRNYAFDKLGATMILDPYHNDINKTHSYHIHIEWAGEPPAGWKPGYVPKQPTKKDISLLNFSTAKAAWTGKAINPPSLVTGGKTLYINKDYTVKSANGNVSVGTGQVVINGKGAYSGEKTINIRIYPKKSSLKALTPRSGKLVVTWAKASAKQKINGYQIRYRQVGKTKWTVKIASKNVTNKILVKLAKGKKYRVQVRCYKRVDGGVYYGAWSAPKISGKIK